MIRFNERVRVNGVPITNDKIVEFVSSYKSAIEKIQSTFFETTTALAYTHFADENVDIAIIETGLGGRLDSTNVLRPDVTVITSITSDHTEILGNSLEKIAAEKGGIIKDNTPLILSNQMDEVRKVLYSIANEKNAKLLESKNADVSEIELLSNGTKFKWQENDYQTGLIGEHQVYNAVLAIEAAREFDKNIADKTIKSGLIKTVWPGRMQLLSSEPPIYYDVAHNPHGIEIAVSTLGKIFNDKPIGILSMKADKELEKIIPKLKNKFQRLIITGIPDEDLMSATDLHSAINKNRIAADLELNIDDAIEKLQMNVTKDTPGLIFGSHYIGKAVFEKFGFSFDNGVI